MASTHEYVLFFTNKGKVYRLKVHELPLASRTARGTAIVNLLPLEEGETVAAVVNTRDFPENDYWFFATREGMVKKTSLAEFAKSRRDGIIAILLRPTDELIAVRRVHEGDKIILVSDAGKAIKWDESQVRPTGRNTMGVKGIALTDGAKLLSMETTNGNGDLFVITEKGYGKRTPISEYPEQNRGGQGVYTIQMTVKKGLLAGVKVIGPQHEIMIVSAEGIVIRVRANDISKLGRSTQGVRIMDVADGDRVMAVARMRPNNTSKAAQLSGQGTLDLNAVTDGGLDEVDLGDGEEGSVDEALEAGE